MGGVIFDLNGTLFWDSKYQEISWDKYLPTHNISLTMPEKKEYIHGRNSKDTFEFLFKRKLDDWEIEKNSEEKEVFYRRECLKHEMKIAPGAEAFLKHLKNLRIPMAIATASGKSNIDFFIEKLNLLHYFNEENIIYNDGKIRGKPHPDLFEKALFTLGVEKSKSVIFEDSFSGIQAAMNTNVPNIIIVNSTKEDYSKYSFPVIEHFDQVDRDAITYKVMHSHEHC